MKKLLSVCLSISIAITPLLGKAGSSANERSRAVQLIQERIQKSEALLKKSGVKILDGKTNVETSILNAIKAKDVLIDLGSLGGGAVRLKILSVSLKGELKLALANLESVSDKNLNNTSLLNLDLNKPVQETLEVIAQSTRGLFAQNKQKRTIAQAFCLPFETKLADCSYEDIVGVALMGLVGVFATGAIANHLEGGRASSAGMKLVAIPMGILVLGYASMVLIDKALGAINEKNMTPEEYQKEVDRKEQLKWDRIMSQGI